jgi:hypothetical protein
VATMDGKQRAMGAHRAQVSISHASEDIAIINAVGAALQC